MPKEKSSGAVLFRKENNSIYYLLLHYSQGHWDFPKGHIEGEETEEETMKREVREETGITDLKVLPDFREWIKYFFRHTYNLKPEEKKKAPWVFKVVDFYLAETKTKQIQLSREHIGYEWLLYQDALKRLTFKNAKNILKKANEYIVEHKI